MTGYNFIIYPVWVLYFPWHQHHGERTNSFTASS